MSLLTPRGTGAIAVIGLSGPGAEEVLAGLFRGRKDLPVAVGKFGSTLRDTVVVVRDGSRLELHCHGGVAVVDWVLDQLRACGAVEIPWPQWIRRQGRTALRAEAAVWLSQALTTRTAGILWDQVRGALDAAVAEVVHALHGQRRGEALGLVERLLAHADAGRHLTQPFRVVFVGQPNVGKSTLVNALLGYPRSLTSPLAGTTRDAVATLTAWEGWPVALIDTAGWQPGARGLDALGMARTEEAARTADLLVLVRDRSQPEVSELGLGAVGEASVRHLRVVNKADLPAAWQPPGIVVSARTGQGLQELSAAIVKALVPSPPPPGAPVPFTDELIAILRRAAERLRDPGSDWASLAEELQHLLRPSPAGG
jgi:tRNA modification GTPase